MENTDGMMEKCMKENGCKTKCTEKGSYLGKTARCMKGNFEMIRDTDRALSNGKMEKFTKVLGKMESNMEKESSLG